LKPAFFLRPSPATRITACEAATASGSLLASTVASGAQVLAWRGHIAGAYS